MSSETNANLVRRYVDGELTPAERDDFQRRLEAEPSLQQQVQFEQTLKERVASVLCAESQAAPAQLAERVTAALRDEQPDESKPTRTSWLRERLRDPQQANWLAVAATLLLVAGAVLFGILGRPIDEWPNGTATEPAVAASALWASGEHLRCGYDRGHLRGKASLSSADVGEDFTKHLGVQVPDVFDLQGFGFEFVGAGHCMVPGPVPSGHLVYRRSDGAMVSVFLMPDQGQLGNPDEALEWFRIDVDECRHEVRCATDGELLYLLVCCDDRVVEGVGGSIMAQLARRQGR
jgi:anti-sigma factor RsiW